MSQIPNEGSSSGSGSGNHVVDYTDYETPSGTTAQVSPIPHEHGDRVVAGSPDLGNDSSRMPTTDKLDSPSSLSPLPVPSDDIPDSSSTITEGRFEGAQAQNNPVSIPVEVKEDIVSHPESLADEGHDDYQTLGTTLLDLFMALTSKQRRELDKLTPHGSALTWKYLDLHESLDEMEDRLKGYKEINVLESKSSGRQTGSFPTILNSLLRQHLRIWKRVYALERDIDEINNPFPDAEHATSDRPSYQDSTALDDNIDSYVSDVQEILGEYYEAAQPKRDELVARKEKLYRLLEGVTSALGQFQKSLLSEHVEAAKIVETLMAWRNDEESPGISHPPTLVTDLRLKQTTLIRAAQDVGHIADMVQRLLPDFQDIDLDLWHGEIQVDPS